MWLTMLWALLPKKYLVGIAGALGALLLAWGAVALYGSRRESAGYHAGYKRASDSVWVAGMKRQVLALDSANRRADSLVTRVKYDSALINAAARTVTKRHITVDTVPLKVACDSIPPLVRIWVRSDTANVPHYADRYIASLLVAEDSLIGRVLLPAIALRDTALAAEHAARIGSDSLAAQYAARLREVQLTPSHSSGSRRWPWVVIGTVAGFIAARHIR